MEFYFWFPPPPASHWGQFTTGTVAAPIDGTILQIGQLTAALRLSPLARLDDVVFYATGAGNRSTGLYGNFSINSLTFNSGATSSVTIANGNSSRTLTMGAGGITVESGSGAHTISVSTVAIGASQNWTNNSSNQLTVSSAVTLGANTLTGGGSGNIRLAGAISGTGAIAKNGAGTLTLAGNSTYTGATTVNAGTLSISGTNTSTAMTVNGGILQIGASDRIANTATMTINSGGTFDHQTYNEQIGALTIDGGTVTSTSGTLTVSSLTSTGGTVHSTGSGALALNGNLTYNTNSGAETALTIGGTVNLSATRTFVIADGVLAGDVLVSGVISGSGGLTKDGDGTLVLGGNNTYTGATTITAGTLQISADDRIYNSGAMTIASAGTFDHQTYNEQIGAMTLNGGTVAGSSGTMTVSSLTSTGGSIHATGSAALSLGGNVTYNTNSGAETALTLGGTVNLNATRTFTVADGVQTNDATINGVIADGAATGGLTKSGAGTLVLANANTYTGATAVSAGVLNIRNSSALGGTSNGTTVSSGAALELQGNIAVGAEALTIGGTGISSGGALRNISGDNSWAGDITLTSNTLVHVVDGTLTLAGTINETGTSNYEIDKYGAGVLVLSGYSPDWNSTGAFSVRIYEGTVEVSNQDNYGDAYSNVWIGDGATLRFADNATLNDSKYYLFQTANSNLEVDTGKTVTISGADTLLDFAWSGYGGTAMNKTGDGTLIIANNQWNGSYGITSSATIYVSGGVIRLDNNNALGQGQSVINSGGTLWISSGVAIANSLTLNSGGLLIVDGTYNGGTLTVNGGTIRGGGTINSTVTVPAGAMVSPGASPGTLTFGGGLDLSGGGEYYWELGALTESGEGTSYDFIDITGGDLTLGGTSVLSINFTDSATNPDFGDVFWDVNHQWKVIDQDGTNVTNFASLLNAIYAKGEFTTVLGSGANQGDVYLLWTYAPEPGTIVLLAVGGAVIILRRRKTIRGASVRTGR